MTHTSVELSSHVKAISGFIAWEAHPTVKGTLWLAISFSVKEMESKTLSVEVGVMNLAASEKCTTTTLSWSFLRLKWNCKILLNEETEPKVFAHSSLLAP